MCKKCDGKLLLLIGEIKGVVSEIKSKQAEIHVTVTTNRVESQKENKELSKDITMLKIRFAGVGAIFGAISGFLSRYIPS